MSTLLARLSSMALFLVVFCLPLVRHWVVQERPVPPIYFEYTSFIFYASDAAVLFFLLTSALRLGERQLRRPAADRHGSEERSGVSIPGAQMGLSWGPAAITLPLGLLVARSAISAVWAADMPLTFYFSGRLLLLFALYLVILNLGAGRRLLIVSFSASILLQAAVAIAQFTRQRELGWSGLGEIPFSQLATDASAILAAGRVWLRAYGLTPHPNILGGILTALLLPVGAAAWRGHRLAILALVVGFTGLAMTFSRAAWLGAAVGGMVFVAGVLGRPAWRKAYGRRLVAPSLLALAGLALFLFLGRDLLLVRLNPAGSAMETRSLDERTWLNQAALMLIRPAPLRGVGAGNFSLAVMPLADAVASVKPQPAHNVPLLATAELGLAGGGLWLWLMLAPLAIAWRELRAGRLSLWAWGLTAGLLALSVIDLFDFYSWGWPQGRLLRWLFWGFWVAAVTRDDE
ncbi:MAG: O-antigen ligase family protein [Chloroflexota bacterium]